MRKVVLPALAITLFVGLLAGNLLGQRSGGGNSKRANQRPPVKWKKSVLDAFFADIRKEVGPGDGPGRVIVVPNGGGSTEPGGSSGSSGGFAWSTIVSAETLEDYIKESITPLAETVVNPGKFKSGRHRLARTLYSTLAVTFGVIAQYDGVSRFKPKAAGLRDKLAQTGLNCKVNSDAAFQSARRSLEDLQALVRGGSLDVPEAETITDFLKVAERPELMKIMERFRDDELKPMTASESEYKTNKDVVLSRGELLAMLAQVITDESYEYADDEGYQAHAKQLQKACADLAAAIKNDDHGKVQSAVGAINTSCDACHGDWR